MYTYTVTKLHSKETIKHILYRFSVYV